MSYKRICVVADFLALEGHISALDVIGRHFELKQTYELDIMLQMHY